MNLPDDCYLAYNVVHEAYYARVLDSGREISVSAASRGGGVAWEFMVEEVNLGDTHIRIKVFGDAFDAFVQLPEFFAGLADQDPRTLAEIAELLESLGAKDVTERADRYGNRLPSQASLPRGLVERLIDLGWAPPNGGA